jgi:hypothetical protein
MQMMLCCLPIEQIFFLASNIKPRGQAQHKSINQFKMVLKMAHYIQDYSVSRLCTPPCTQDRNEYQEYFLGVKVAGA